jgi:hypothetical protein
MFVPALCPTCTAIVIVPTSGVLAGAGSRLVRCPSCLSVRWQADGGSPPAMRDDRCPTGPPASRP